MTTCERQRGFTLIEIVIVLGVLGLLLGAVAPLASAVIDADRRQEVQSELASLGTSLESYYHDYAAFPATLADGTFYGVYLQPGVGGTATIDPFAAGQSYRYSVDPVANAATVYSLGENRLDNGVANEEFVAVISGAIPGGRKTQQRLRLVIEVLANHVEAGGSVAGSWATVRAAMGLGASYDRDGWGTVLQWDGATHTLTSAGPDRTFGTGDDIGI